MAAVNIKEYIMQLNPSPNVRLAIYLITSLAGVLISYLSTTGQIGAEAVSAFSAVVAIVAGLAGYNVQK